MSLDESIIATIDLSHDITGDISEMDHDRFEAIPTDALKSHEPSIPSKIFGPDELREGFVELLTKFQLVFQQRD